MHFEFNHSVSSCSPYVLNLRSEKKIISDVPNIIDLLHYIDRDKLVSKYETKRDIIQFSMFGKKMNLMFRQKNSVDIVQQWKTVTKKGTDKDLKWIDKNISEVGKMLEQMKNLAIAARDESLDEHVRMAMQINLGSIQHEMNIKMATMLHVYIHGDNEETQNYYRKKYGTYEASSSYQMMVRAMDRIANGEKWDVAEIAHVIMARDGELTPLNRYCAIGTKWGETDDLSVPTVGEILRGKGRSLMSVEEASVTLRDLEKSTESLKKFRDNFASFAEKNHEPTSEEGIQAFDDAKNALVSGLMNLFSGFFKDAAQVTFGNRITEDGGDYDEMLKRYRSAKLEKSSGGDYLFPGIIPIEESSPTEEELFQEAFVTHVQLSSQQNILDTVLHPLEEKQQKYRLNLDAVRERAATCAIPRRAPDIEKTTLPNKWPEVTQGGEKSTGK